MAGFLEVPKMFVMQYVNEPKVCQVYLQRQANFIGFPSSADFC